MGKRRRSSKGSQQNSPIADLKKTKAGSPGTSNRQGKSSLAVASTSYGGYYAPLIPENQSTITEAATAENQSELGGFGEEFPNNIVPGQPHQAKTKFPPIVVKNVPLDKLKRDLQSNGVQAQFKLTRIGIKVVVLSKSELDRTKAYLKKLKAEFFTHDIQEEKPFKAVVRGLPIMAKEDIEAELIHRYKLQPVACYVISRKQDHQDFRDCLYLIHFRKGTVTLNALKAVRSISSVIVSWEAYRGSHRDVTQCMRCLNFGHGTRNCSLKPRCNICGGKHISTECPYEDVAEFKCANCGQGHKASDKNCVKREDYKRIRKEASMRNLPGRRAPSDHQIFGPEAFPVLQQGRNTQHQQLPNQVPVWQHRPSGSPSAPSAQQQQSRTQVSPNHPSPPETDNAIPQNEIYAPEELVRIFLEMSVKLQQCRTRHAQIETLGVFLIQYGR